ncbi:MAG: hypothetical protein NUV82_01780 [Candidatus Komeilibacteria bacterium]|nr:hypothetical protein [Candidatus Komeilibacteria bacterium]
MKSSSSASTWSVLTLISLFIAFVVCYPLDGAFTLKGEFAQGFFIFIWASVVLYLATILINEGMPKKSYNDCVPGFFIGSLYIFFHSMIADIGLFEIFHFFFVLCVEIIFAATVYGISMLMQKNQYT